MIFVTLELARRLELAEAEACRASAEAVSHHSPEVGAAWQSFNGGWAVFCGVNSPLTQAIGAGLGGAVTPAEFDAMEEFFRSRGAAVNLEVCPLAHASLFEILAAHSYRIGEVSDLLARPLSREDRFDARAPGVAILPCEPGTERIWAETVSQCFVEEIDVTPELVSVMESFVRRPGGRTMLAQVEGKTVAGAALAIWDGVAGMFGAGTLPEFRGRGIQTALLAYRLEEAAKAGCDVAVSFTQPGSTSERNLVRQGFRVLYTRLKFMKP